MQKIHDSAEYFNYDAPTKVDFTQMAEESGRLNRRRNGAQK